MTIKFKLPYVNDKLIYRDNTNNSQGYILKDGSYSKKLSVSSLKKVELMESKYIYYNGLDKNFLKTTRLLGSGRVESLGWKAKVNFNDGINQLYQWFLKIYIIYVYE